MLLSATDAAAMETTLHVPEMKTYSWCTVTAMQSSITF